ncbi:glycosyltransferase family 4 protein [Rhodopirellula bahusiensis]|uniref:Glycosyl transferase family 1 n=1 Tax=Rhodopirellula bahusiensis TaxID=2014065 RepID=A0A2G1W3H7_9BACT|nr:glycosyltransferase family 4 protein [Rhodopirellula bahusiensis]PHQ33420.1 glycosyl transferase family 1 [Rhodopirellula bahusiensis]
MSAVLPTNSDSDDSPQTCPLVGSSGNAPAAHDGSAVTESRGSMATDGLMLDAKAVFLTHYIPLYQVRVLQEITKRIRDFQILLSTPIEPNRDFQLDWSGLNVEVQKTVTLRRRWRHAKAGFDDPLFVHVPYDTLKQLKRIRPDVVISHELGARSLAAARYCRRSGARLVLATFMSEHTEQGRGRVRSWARRRLIRSADAITYNGPSCREVLLSLGAREDQLFHLPYAADDRIAATETQRPAESDVRRKLLCIGQLSQRKGVLPLVRQASDFCAANNEAIEITFVGDGPCRSELETLASGSSTDDNAPIDSRLKIHLLGNRPAAELPELMRAHGAIIAPTLADEWLLVTNEGMHAGMPIIGSIYAQSVTTLVRNGRNGWQYDPLASEATSSTLNLSGALKSYLATDESTIKAMRENAKHDIREYTPQRSAMGAIDAIRSALNRRDADSTGNASS